MQRARRLMSMTVVAALGIGVLAGCQQDPSVAAYVGAERYTEVEVDRIYNDAKAKFDEQQAANPQNQATQEGAAAPAPPPELFVTRQHVVDLLVSLDLGKRLVAEGKFESAAQPVPASAIAGALGMSETATYVEIWTEWNQVFSALSENIAAKPLDDAGLLRVYNALVDAEAIEPGLPVAKVREAFGEGQFATSAIAVSEALSQQATKLGADINPRFEPLGAPLLVVAGGQPIFYELPYVQSDAVIDAR